MSDLCVVGQCLACGGRGGWWVNDHRRTCGRCEGGGWDPDRDRPWFPRAEQMRQEAGE